MKQNKFFKYLGTKVRFSIRSVRTSTELWHITLRRITLLFNCILLLLLMFGGVALLVIYSPLLDFMPGYPGSQSRKILLTKISKLDSLDHQVRKWEQYTTQMQMILEGRIVQDTSALGQSNIKGKLKRTTTPRSISDSTLRQGVQKNIGKVESKAEIKHSGTPNLELINPISGTITQAFNPNIGHLGVLLTPRPNTPVQVIKDGTVISSSWSPESGYTVIVQHPQQMLSKYTHLAKTLYNTGDRVASGDAIGVSESITEQHTPTFGLELWVEGSVVNPEDFVSFQ